MTRTMGFRTSICAVVSCYLLLAACESREPGCLDVFSENYDVNAVSECDSCCIYPQVNLSVEFAYDTFDFRFGAFMPYQETDSVSIEYIQLPFSLIDFYDGASVYKVADTIRSKSPQERDDYLIIESSDRSEPIGRSDFVVSLDSFICHVGLDPVVAARLQPYENVSNSSKFIDVIEDMYVDSTETLVQARLRLTIGDSTRSLEILDIMDPIVGVTAEVEITLGIPWIVNMAIDLSILVEGIDASDTNEVMATTIGRNISAAILRE